MKVGLVKLHLKLTRLRGAINGFLSHDPWALLSLFRLRNWTPIKHEPDKSRPVRVSLNEEGEVIIRPGVSPVENDTDDFTAYIVSGYDSPLTPRGKKKVHHKVTTGEPLGPEDYSLGEKVPPETEAEERLEALWPRPIKEDQKL